MLHSQSGWTPFAFPAPLSRAALCYAMLLLVLAWRLV
jgi:hypothetical protein